MAIAAVKGTRLRSVNEVSLDRHGVAENRRFFLIDERDRMVNAKHHGELNAIVADYDAGERRLALTFPDGRVVDGRVAAGDHFAARFYSRTLDATLVTGPWSAAVSEFVGQRLRLVEAPDQGTAVDRGAGAGVSLISQASLARLAEAAGEDEVDTRRFRMLIEIDGVPAHAEDQWVGRRAQVGGATVHFRGHVGRCLITSRHPDTGTIDLPTLDIIRSYRPEGETTEPLPFGVYGDVLAPGTVRVGDPVRVHEP